MLATLRSTLFNLIFPIGTFFYVSASLLVAPLGERPLRTVVHGWSRFHRWLVRHLLGIRFEWVGTIPDGPCLIAVKHESMAEAVDTLSFAQTPIVVMKRELTTMPLFGAVTRKYGVIGVDREAGASALRHMMAEAKVARDSGRPIIIFPEGTRVAHGDMPPLKPGFAGLYRMLGLPVVPIAMDSGRLWGRGWVKRPGVVRFVVGETIPPGLKREEVEARVHPAINALNHQPAAP